jgi:autotransporter passenger strand-loop-strand repeat protein
MAVTVGNTTVDRGGVLELLGHASGTTTLNHSATLEIGSGCSIKAPHRWQMFRCCPVDAGLELPALTRPFAGRHGRRSNHVIKLRITGYLAAFDAGRRGKE